MIAKSLTDDDEKQNLRITGFQEFSGKGRPQAEEGDCFEVTSDEVRRQSLEHAGTQGNAVTDQAVTGGVTAKRGIQAGIHARAGYGASVPHEEEHGKVHYRTVRLFHPNPYLSAIIALSRPWQ